MTTAFVLGNGRSRQAVDLLALKQHGPIYACNAIYREFTPDVLVATDLPIATVIQESGYAQKNKFYTRRPLPNSGAHRLCKEYMGFSSGPNAVGLACLDGYTRIYMLGFDLGTANGKFNNLYADTDFYKKSSAPPTFSGNWIRQIAQICNKYPTRQFIRVQGPESAPVYDLAQQAPNMKFMEISEFKDLLNTSKGLL
jgi:hypothetical protein